MLNSSVISKPILFLVKVHVLIVQAIGLPPMDNGLNSDPYCKVRYYICNPMYH